MMFFARKLELIEGLNWITYLSRSRRIRCSRGQGVVVVVISFRRVKSGLLGWFRTVPA